MENPENRQLTLDQLPQWMRPYPRKPDYALLAMFLLCCVVALPWLTQDGLPNTPSTQIELARIAETADSFETGVIYPRWASHFHFGYGSPIFNYLAPAPHYLGGLHLLLTQTNPTVSLKTLVTLCIFAAGLGMFGFARRRWGELVGILAGLLYLLSPQIIFRQYLELDLGLLMAAALFPVLLWLLDRTLSTGNRRDIAALSLITALLISSSNLMGPLLLFVAMIWASGIIWRGGHVQAALMGLGLGVGLTSLYWLPAIAEWGAVHWIPLDQNLRPLSLREVLDIPHLTAVYNPAITGQLGIATWILALFGIVAVIWNTYRYKDYSSLCFAISGLGLLSVAVGVPSHWLDQTALFPHLSRIDLLIPVTVCCVILAAEAVHSLSQFIPNASRQIIVLGMLTLGIVGASIYTLKPPAFTNTADSIDSYMQAELRGAFSGSFLNGHLLPAETRELPPPSYPLLASYALGQVLKVESTSRLSGTNLSVISHGAQHDTLHVNILQETEVEILTLNFEGWRAEFKHEPVAIHTAPERGFMVLTVPSGQDNLRVYLGSTAARSIAILISLGSLGLLLLLFWGLKIEFPKPPKTDYQSVFMGAALGLLAAVSILSARLIDLQPNSPGYQNYAVTFENDIQLLGYELNQVEVQPEDILNLSLYWEALHPNLSDYEVEIKLVSVLEGYTIRQYRRALGGWLSSFWNANQVIEDNYGIRIPADAPADRYLVSLTLLSCESSDNPYTCRQPTPLKAGAAESLHLPVTLTVIP